MNPPLAAREDRDALLAGLADGTVDAIATDHAPHEPALKDVEFDRAPLAFWDLKRRWGLHWNCVHSGKISLMRMVELFTDRSGASAWSGTKNCEGRNGRSDDFFDRP